MFARSFGVSLKTVEALENSRNKLKESSCRLLEIVRDETGFLKWFQVKWC